jgi:alanyl-tRNA synthetase
LTERLYQDDSYATTFRSRVTSITRRDDAYAIGLAATLFYPETGSQPADTGHLGDIAIQTVIEEGEEVLHLSLEEPSFASGDTVEGRIDWPRRFINMQQHTGQHILSAVFARELDARTVSSKLGTEACTIDVARLGLGWDQMELAERCANAVVYENRPVKIYRAPAGEVTGLRYKLELADQILDRDILRIVEVEGLDKSPCGGTQCRMTGEVGLIKILRWEKVRETTRVEFICGRLAEADYFWKSRFIVDLAKQLTTKDVNLPAYVQDLIEAHKDLRLRLGEFNTRVLHYEAAELAGRARQIGPVRLVRAYLRDKADADIREIAAYLAGSPGTVALLACGRAGVHFVFARSTDVEVDMRQVMGVACRVVEGRGGGKPDFCEGGGKTSKHAEAALDESEKAVADMVKPPGAR